MGAAPQRTSTTHLRVKHGFALLFERDLDDLTCRVHTHFAGRAYPAEVDDGLPLTIYEATSNHVRSDDRLARGNYGTKTFVSEFNNRPRLVSVPLRPYVAVAPMFTGRRIEE